MGRAIVGVVVGLIVSWVVVFAGLTAAYMGLGVEKVYKPGVYEVSSTWILVSIVVGLAGALIAGVTCAKIAKATKPAFVLALVMFVLGLVMVFMEMQKDHTPQPRLAEATMFEAMEKTTQPVWVAMLNPVIGSVGVIAGAFVALGGMPKKQG